MFDDLTQCLQLILKNMSNEHQNLSLVRSSVLVAYYRSNQWSFEKMFEAV